MLVRRAARWCSRRVTGYRAWGESIHRCRIPAVPLSVAPVSLDEQLSLPIMGVLKRKTEPMPPALPVESTLRDAVRFLTRWRTGTAIVVDGSGNDVVGLVTARDVLRALDSFDDAAHAWSCPIEAAITPKSKLVHVEPQDSIAVCLFLMSELRIRSLLVVEDAEKTAEAGVSEMEVKGMLSLKELMDTMQEPILGGKGAALKTLGARQGLHGVVRVTGVPIAASQDVSSPLLGAFRLRSAGVSLARPQRYEEPNEDAWLLRDIHWPGTLGERLGQLTYACIADGVGSWKERGVDPAAFSHALVNALGDELDDMESKVERRKKEKATMPPSPLRLLQKAWQRTVKEEMVIGSSTACVMTLDTVHGHLVAANVGDSGFLVIRSHQETEGRLGTLTTPPAPSLNAVVTASSSSLHRSGSRSGGVMHPTTSTTNTQTQTPEGMDEEDLVGVSVPAPSYASPPIPDTPLHVAYRSHQQLAAFNQPFQLGYAPGDEDLFQTPADADVIRVPVLPGDIIILASDGLFDNLFEADLLAELDAHMKHDPDFKDPGKLAKRLADLSREYAVDKFRESPFGELAKENDILYGGGMPDDVTVVIAVVEPNIMDFE